MSKAEEQPSLMTHVYTYVTARYSYSYNEVLQNINYCEIYHKLHCMKWLALRG